MRIAVSSSVLAVLEGAGWSEQRHRDVATLTTALVEAGFEINERHLEILASFDGLSVQLPALPTMSEYFINDDPLVVDPLGIGMRNLDEARALEDLFGGKFCPFGWWLSRSHVYIGSGGLSVAVLPGVIWRLGDSFDKALDFMILADAPLDRAVSLDGLG